MNRDNDPIPITSQEDGPLWESDIDEREARRRKLLFFGGSAVAVLAGFGVLYAGLSWLAGSLTAEPSDPQAGTILIDGRETIELSSAPAPAEPSAPMAALSELDWYAIEAPLGNSRRLFATEAGTFYALSTIPGQAINWPVPPALYKSTDGENWEMIPLDGNNSATDLAAGGTSLYLIGTAPGRGDRTEPQQFAVSASQDEGASWTTTLLSTVAAPPGGAPIEWSDPNARVAATDSTVVALVNTQFFLDYRLIVPAEFAGDFEYRPMPDGVNVIDHQQRDQAFMACENEMGQGGGDFDDMSEECQALFNGDDSTASIAFFTWEELNLPGEGGPMFSELFVSTDDGTTFEAVDSPFTAGSDVIGLFAIPDGFVATESIQGQTSIWRSADGRSWQQADAVPNFDWVSHAGAFNGDVVIVGQGRQGSSLAWETEDGGWNIVDFDELLGPAPPNGGRWLSSAAVGPLGVVAVFQGFDERTEREIAQAAIGTSPEDWTLVAIEEITGMAGGYSDWAVVGRDQIIIRYEVHGRFRPLSLQVMGVRTG